MTAPHPTPTHQDPPSGVTPTALGAHSAYSDPGPYAELLAGVPPVPEELSAVARNVIVHYRHSGHDLPEGTRGDIHARWIARTLELDQQRHGSPLAEAREPRDRVQGCCRDHSLFSCAVLRQHGVPARGRIGFAGYFEDGYHHDHVVVEMWEPGDGAAGGRWRRFDPEVPDPDERVASPMDLPTGPGSPFITAAEAWRGWRAGELDASRFGAGPGVGPEGPWFLQHYVLREAAHRHGDELLLWDVWGAMAEPGTPIQDAVLALTDEVAALLVAADEEEQALGRPATRATPRGTSVGHGGHGATKVRTGRGGTAADEGAGARLARWYAADPRLHPGGTVLRFDPFEGPGEPPTPADLTPYP